MSSNSPKFKGLATSNTSHSVQNVNYLLQIHLSMGALEILLLLLLLIIIIIIGVGVVVLLFSDKQKRRDCDISITHWSFLYYSLKSEKL